MPKVRHRRSSLTHKLIKREEERRVFERRQIQRNGFHAWCTEHWEEVIGRPWTEADQWIWNQLEEARRQGKQLILHSGRNR